jgi:hypothetical protein
VALGQVFLREFLYSSVSIIPPLLHIHSRIIWGMDNGSVIGCSSIETQSHSSTTIKTCSDVSKIFSTTQSTVCIETCIDFPYRDADFFLWVICIININKSD